MPVHFFEGTSSKPFFMLKIGGYHNLQYFKHMSAMRNDVKIRRLINKYGLEGYGLYNLILESITEKLTTESPIPDLQETCEDIAEFYNGNSARINEMANFMINQGLFEIDEITGRIVCNKLYKFLEQNQTRSKQIRLLIASWKKKQPLLLENVSDCRETDKDMSETFTDKSDRTEQNRTEKNRKEQNIIPPTLEMVSNYCKERNNKIDPDNFINFYQSKNWMIGKNKMKDWQAAIRTWEMNNKSKQPEEKPDWNKLL